MCTESGRRCQGYETPMDGRTREARDMRMVNGHNVVPVPRHQQLAPGAGLICLTDGSQVGLSSMERHYMNSFRSHTSVQCAGLAFDPFWQILVHQASETHPAVRHSVIAISALHRQFLDPTSHRTDLFPINQCNKAIGHLRAGIRSNAHLDSSQTERILIACVVLITFGLLQGDVEAVRCHLQSGTRLLYEWRKTNGKRSSLASVLLHTFVQLHIHWANVTAFRGYMRGEYPYLGELLSDNLADISDFADDDEQARTTLLLSIRAWMVMINNFTQSKGKSTIVHRMEDFLLGAPSTETNDFRSQLEHCVAAGKASSPIEQRALLMVKINRETLWILNTAAANFAGDEMGWDTLLSHFKVIVDTAEELLSSFEQLPDFSFSAKEGFMGSLMLCGIKCRDWTIRQRLMSLFQKYNRREGVSSSAQSIALLKRICQLENSGTSPEQVVPDCDRITMVIVEEHANHSHRVPKVRFRYQDRNREWQSESLEL
ncbi:unnamed protein product [Penicillium salamii]|nr:unnamed protein product [Penicillium salamii]CAG8317334.1 unnamed protein product [Penicillium salamii]CAG8324516.1 unnamed protein product [Penicillium salamii]